MLGFTKFVLTAAAVLCFVCTVGAAEFDGGGTSQDPYLIKSLDDMTALSAAVSGGESFSGCYFELTADIDMSGIDWQPIGTSSASFKGSFNGCGHSIKNMTVKSEDYAGLFGYGGTGFSVSHLKLDGGSVYTAGTYAGGIVGRVGSTSTVYIYDCENDGCTVTAANSSACIGGILGAADTANAVIEYCTNSASVYPEDENCTYVGGIAGYLCRYSTSSGVKCVRVINCKNYGAVGGADVYASYTGGIMGYYYSSSYVYNCENHGSIVSGGNDVGGIVGYGLGTAYLGGCFNNGDVSGCIRVGGIAGRMGTNLYLSCSTTFPTATSTHVGSIAGYLNSGTLKYCYSTQSENMVGYGSSDNYSSTESSFSACVTKLNKYLSRCTSTFAGLQGFSDSEDDPFDSTDVDVELYSDDSLIDTITVTEGEAYGDLPTPAKSGYTFDGWYTTTGGQYKIESSTTAVLSWYDTAGKTLYAHWTQSAEGSLFDVDGSGTVDEADAALILKHTIGKETLSNGDVNGDGTTDIRDAVLVLKNCG